MLYFVLNKFFGIEFKLIHVFPPAKTLSGPQAAHNLYSY